MSPVCSLDSLETVRTVPVHDTRALYNLYESGRGISGGGILSVCGYAGMDYGYMGAVRYIYMDDGTNTGLTLNSLLL